MEIHVSQSEGVKACRTRLGGQGDGSREGIWPWVSVDMRAACPTRRTCNSKNYLEFILYLSFLELKALLPVVSQESGNHRTMKPLAEKLFVAIWGSKPFLKV